MSNIERGFSILPAEAHGGSAAHPDAGKPRPKLMNARELYAELDLPPDTEPDPTPPPTE